MEMYHNPRWGSTWAEMKYKRLTPLDVQEAIPVLAFYCSKVSRCVQVLKSPTRKEYGCTSCDWKVVLSRFHLPSTGQMEEGPDGERFWTLGEIPKEHTNCSNPVAIQSSLVLKYNMAFRKMLDRSPDKGTKDTRLLFERKGVSLQLNKSQVATAKKCYLEDLVLVPRKGATDEQEIHETTTTSKKKGSKSKERVNAVVDLDDADMDTPAENSGSNIDPDTVIGKSPYEPKSNAEDGEELFTTLKKALQLRKERTPGYHYQAVNNEAAKVFGAAKGLTMVQTHDLIQKSGIVYSQEWLTGKIRGDQVEMLPKELLLLCLVSTRLVKTEELTVCGLVRDFELWGVVQEAIHTFNIPFHYPNILRRTKNFYFPHRRRDCLKCMIFIARTHACYNALVIKKEIDSSLYAKIVACLDLIEANIGDNHRRGKKAVETIDVADDDFGKDNYAAAENSAKRKPRMSRKKSLGRSAVARGDDESHDTLSFDIDDEIEYEPPPRKRRQKTSKATAVEHVSETVASRSSSSVGSEGDDGIEYKPPPTKRRRESSRASQSSSSVGSAEDSKIVKLLFQCEEQYEELTQTLYEFKDKLLEERRNGGADLNYYSE